MLAVFATLSALIVCKQNGGRFYFNYRGTGFLFMLMITGLVFSQMIMYPPGSDISPYAFMTGQLSHILFAGRTFSSWVSIAIAAYCIYKVFITDRIKRMPQQDVIMYACAVVNFVVGVISYYSFGSALSEGTKYILPFLVFGLVKALDSSRFNEAVQKLLTYTNIVLILQVLVCKVVTGRFAASTYYHEMQQEFFGFYNHPHGYTGLLGMLTIWCVYNINRRRHTLLYGGMAVVNMLLMYISGSRSYVYSLLIAVAYILAIAILDKKLSRLRKYTLAAAVAAVFFGHVFISRLGANRVSNTVLSGRETRWINDMGYYFSNMGIWQKLIGGGFGYINDVNKELSGVFINSLNIFIDVLINNGIVGILLTVIAYWVLFSTFAKKGDRQFTMMTLFFFVVSSFVTNLITYQVITITMVLMLYAMSADSEEASIDSDARRVFSIE